MKYHNGIKELIQGREMMTMYCAISALRPTILLIRYLPGILGDLQKLPQKEKVRVQTLHVHLATVQTEIFCRLYYKHNI